MQLLSQEIESALQIEKHCFVRPEQLERVWPQVGGDRLEKMVRDFAREHHWRIFYYSRALGAMFVRDSTTNYKISF